MLIGVMGGGQLGRMLALAGAPLGIRCRFWDPDPEVCAAPLGEHVVAPQDDPAALAAFCDGLDAATYEFENVPVKTADAVADRVVLRPGARSLELTQDRLTEKEFLRACGVSIPAFAPVGAGQPAGSAVAHTGLPAVLKSRRMGYDGKGQRVIRTHDEAAGVTPGVLEAFVPFRRELSVVLVRAASGETAVYPVAENTHEGGVLRVTRLPASCSAAVADEAVRTAQHLAGSMNHVGALCVEFFETDAGLLVNEIAPRVHNTGHWTIDGAGCSQFENHLRAVAGLELGPTASCPACVMFNFIGEAPDAAAVLALDPAAHLHLYGKSPRAGRKLGHVTLTDQDAGALAARAGALAGLPGVGGGGDASRGVS